MNFRHAEARMLVPDGLEPSAALDRVTHLGIGAHQDDLEFMALHGILACHGHADAWFGGVTCTNGCGSPGAPGGRKLSDIRRDEQDEASRIGGYAVMVQLGYASREAKDPADARLTDDLTDLLRACRPSVVYTHNPADKHETHIAVVARVVQAVRRLPAAERPARLLGCEVWRDLDWLSDDDKVRLDVSGNPALAERLAAVFSSQIQGKRYDLAVRGRERANATFLDSHAVDGPGAVWHAMDLTPLVISDTISIAQFVNAHLARFKNDVLDKLARWES